MRSNLPDAWLHPVAFTLALAIVVYLHVVLGEMVPKNLAIAGPERAAMVLGPPMVAIVALLKPIVYGLDAVANAIVRLLRVEPRNEVISTFTLEEVEAMVDESHDEGMLDESEYERLAGALGFTSRTVEDVLLPLDQLETVARGARATDVEAACGQTGYSRFPVVGEGGTMVGYLHIKDVIQADPTDAHGSSRRPGSDRSPRCVFPTPWSARCRRSRPRALTWPPCSTSPARSSGWSPSRTSSRSSWARSGTPPTPRATEDLVAGQRLRGAPTCAGDPAEGPAPWWEGPPAGLCSAEEPPAGCLDVH